MSALYPLFPLPELLLYPQALMPLQLFEPRYVRMMRDMLDQDADRIVLATLKPGFEDQYFERPPCHEVAGLGRMLKVEEVPGDRFHLLLQGETRVKLLDEAPDENLPYRRVSVMPLTEPEPVGTEADALRAELRAVLESDTARLARPEEVTLGWMTDVLLVQLSEPIDTKQELFSLVDPLLRARRVLEVWQRHEETRQRLDRYGGEDPQRN